jgi:hypothetical protein
MLQAANTSIGGYSRTVAGTPKYYWLSDNYKNGVWKTRQDELLQCDNAESHEQG